MRDSLAIALSVLSGRKDVCDLDGYDRLACGITFDPKNSVELKNEALILLEEIVLRAVRNS